jgi:hypothetical protein
VQRLFGTKLWEGEWSFCFVMKDGCVNCYKKVSELKREKCEGFYSLWSIGFYGRSYNYS